jgi:NAD(P)-dependent dehydrogenase (short-subunit alcohol dehydrogenase family)
MKDLAGKVAVITGGASGIGLGMAHAFAAAGMRVALLDVEGEALRKAASAVARHGAEVIHFTTDVSKLPAMELCARKVEDEFGAAHLLCNNAGVNVYKDIADTTADDWTWLLDVNLRGVANGVSAFLPGMSAHGQGGHIVNTASIAGLIPLTGLGAYAATKHAVVGLTGALRLELAPRGIGVSCFCPGPVTTQIGRSSRNRPEQDDSAVASQRSPERLQIKLPGYIDPAIAADLVLKGVLENRPYIMTHAEFAAPIQEQCLTIAKAFDEIGS